MSRRNITKKLDENNFSKFQWKLDSNIFALKKKLCNWFLTLLNMKGNLVCRERRKKDEKESFNCYIVLEWIYFEKLSKRWNRKIDNRNKSWEFFHVIFQRNRNFFYHKSTSYTGPRRRASTLQFTKCHFDRKVGVKMSFFGESFHVTAVPCWTTHTFSLFQNFYVLAIRVYTITHSIYINQMKTFIWKLSNSWIKLSKHSFSFSFLLIVSDSFILHRILINLIVDLRQSF